MKDNFTEWFKKITNGDTAQGKAIFDEDMKAKEWFKHKYPGLINNWGDYEKNKREEEKDEKSHSH